MANAAVAAIWEVAMPCVTSRWADFQNREKTEEQNRKQNVWGERAEESTDGIFLTEPQISARKHGGVNLNKYEHEIFLNGK